MKTPKIKTNKGVKPITVIPNELLIEAYLGSAEDGEEKDLVQLLRYAEPSNVKAAKILRECLIEGRKLVAVYPGNDETPPKGATLVGSITDGSLYVV